MLHVVPSVPSSPLRRWAKLSSVLNNPSSLALKKFHANCKAVALQRLAVGYSSRGTKLSIARGQHQPVVRLPPAHADYASASHADVLRERRFRTGYLPVSFEEDADFHGNAILGAIERVNAAAKWRHGMGSQARRNSRQIVNAAPAMLHAVESAIGRSEKFFRRIAVFGKRSHAGARGKCRRFRFCGHALAYP